MRASVRLVSAFALGVLGLPLAGTTTAYAHATLISSTPAQDDVLETLPDEVSFVFSEAMDPVAYVIVTAPDGTALSVGDPVVDDDTVTQAIDDADDGTYLMAVKAVSSDGHPLTGRVEFAVGEPSAPVDTEESDPGSSADAGPGRASSSSVTGTAAAGRTAWHGHDTWVWLVGPTFAGAALALWLIGRRSSDDAQQAGGVPRS